jgi:hypothetical protein
MTDDPHATARYHRDRDRVRGQRWLLPQDPDQAAEELATNLGGVRRAQQWAAELVAALKRRAA